MSDRAPAFIQSIFAKVSARLGITRLSSAPYHPEGNAVIESFHCTLSTGLRSVDQQTLSFPEALDLVLFGYRAVIHSTTGHSPCFMAFGVDPRLALDCDWRGESPPALQERLKFLSLLRLDVQLQAQNALNRQNMLKNEERSPAQFEEGQLVLCRSITMEQLHYRTAFFKAVPRWTLPHRVVRVLPAGKMAIVRCLVTGKTREVHIQDVQFISPPQGPAQQAEWHELVKQEARTMFDPEQCQEVIDQFFDNLDAPQLPPAETGKAKRPRVSDVWGG